MEEVLSFENGIILAPSCKVSGLHNPPGGKNELAFTDLKILKNHLFKI